MSAFRSSPQEAMNEAPFDTLGAARELEAAGIERRQAEAIAGAIRNGEGDLVTKDHLDARLAGLEARLVERERRFVKWAATLVGAVVVILGVSIRFPAANG